MQLISVASYKGGCGKSTTAIHVATYFSEFLNVLLVDADPNETCLNWFMRGHLPFRVLGVEDALKDLANYELVVLDTQARPKTPELKDLVEDSDVVIIPTTADIVSGQVALLTVDALYEIGLKDHRILLTMVAPRPNTDAQEMRTDLEDRGVPVFKTQIRRSTGFTRCALEGVPIRDLKGKSRLAWRDYQILGEELWESLNKR